MRSLCVTPQSGADGDEAKIGGGRFQAGAVADHAEVEISIEACVLKQRENPRPQIVPTPANTH